MSDRPEDRPPPNFAVRESMVDPAGLALDPGAPRPPGDGSDAPSAIDADEALLAAYAAGDAAAFARLYDRHARATWRFIRHRLGPANEAAADVVLEDSWIEAAHGAMRVAGASHWTSWLYALVRRRALCLPGRARAPRRTRACRPSRPRAHRIRRRRRAPFLARLAGLPAPAREAAVLHFETGLDAAWHRRDHRRAGGRNRDAAACRADAARRAGRGAGGR